MNKNKQRVYNDGVCFIVEEDTNPSSFAAKKNGKQATDFKNLFRLMFEEMSKREQDFEFADQAGGFRQGGRYSGTVPPVGTF